MSNSNRKKLYLIMTDFKNQMKRANISAYAGSIAFFFFLSLVPMLMVICTVIPFTPLTEADLVTAITEVTPDMVDELVVSLVAEVYSKSAGVLSIAILATIWSAGKGVLALIRGLNAVYEVDEDRNYFVLRFVASFYTVIMLIILILSLFVMVFGNQLVSFALHRIPQLEYIVQFIMHFRFIFVWCILSLLFAAMYAYIPNVKMNYNEQLPGAVFSAVVWSVFSYFFSIYVNMSDSIGVYGSLSIIVIIMIWMYACMYIILIGAYMNRYFSPVNKVFFKKKDVSHFS